MIVNIHNYPTSTKAIHICDEDYYLIEMDDYLVYKDHNDSWNVMKNDSIKTVKITYCPFCGAHLILREQRMKDTWIEKMRCAT